MPPINNEKLSFLTPNFIEHIVGNTTQHFYPVSVGLAFELRKVAAPLAEALTVLFTKTDNDTGTVRRQFGPENNEVILEPVRPELASVRHKHQSEAVVKLVEALTAKDSLEVVARIIMDSMKDTFGKKLEWPPPVEFLEATPLPMLTEMLIGVAKANKEVFGPLALSLKPLAENALANIKAKVGDLPAPTASATATAG